MDVIPVRTRYTYSCWFSIPCLESITVMANTKITEEERQELKDKFVKYFEDVPVQKYAAMHIGVTEQTIVKWKDEDESFLNAVNLAKSSWVKKKMLTVKAEFALERLEKDVFKESKDIDLSTPQPILVQFIGADSDSTTTDNNNTD